MRQRLKPKKCLLKTCRKDFQPVTEWQKYCSPRCRGTVANHERARLVRKAQRQEAAEQKAAS